MQHRDRMTLLLEFTRDTIGAVFSAAENEDLVVIGAAQEFFQKYLLLVRIDRVQRMGYRLGGRTALARFDFFGLGQGPLQKLFLFWGIVNGDSAPFTAPPKLGKHSHA